MQPLVSIIMPAYNVEKYISKSIESVLKQKYTKFELIIINDGSPDQSGEIAEDYAKKDIRVSVIHKKNGGLSDARNTGMKLAKGKYIFFIDSDDYIDENLLQSLVDPAEKHNADVIMCGYFVDVIDDLEEKIYSRNICYKYDIYEKDNFRNIQLNSNLFKMVGYAWNKLYKLQMLKENDFIFTKGLSLVEDIVFNLPVLSKVNKLIIIDQALYHYIQRRRKTLVNMFYKDAFPLHLQGIKSRKKLFEEWGIDQEILNEFIAREHMEGIRYCCANLFYYKNQLSLKDKYNYIKFMFNEKFTKEIKTSFQCTSKKDSVMKYIIKYRMTILLMMLYLSNARIRRKLGCAYND